MFSKHWFQYDYNNEAPKTNVYYTFVFFKCRSISLSFMLCFPSFRNVIRRQSWHRARANIRHTGRSTGPGQSLCKPTTNASSILSTFHQASPLAITWVYPPNVYSWVANMIIMNISKTTRKIEILTWWLQMQWTSFEMTRNYSQAAKARKYKDHSSNFNRIAEIMEMLATNHEHHSLPEKITHEKQNNSIEFDEHKWSIYELTRP